MGYAHYWKLNGRDSIKSYDAKFKKSVDDACKYIARIPNEIPEKAKVSDGTAYGWCEKTTGTMPFVLCGPYGTGKPIFEEQRISFNGDATTDRHHDTFTIESGTEGMQACTTGREAYDVAVCIALLCFQKNFGADFHIISNGDISRNEAGWKLAKRITQGTL